MVRLMIAVAILTFMSATAFAGGGNYFSGPGRSPSYGSKAIAAGFGPGASTKSSQQQASNSGQTCGCGQTNGDNPGHH